jgi:hypothetical protein
VAVVAVAVRLRCGCVSGRGSDLFRGLGRRGKGKTGVKLLDCIALMIKNVTCTAAKRSCPLVWMRDQKQDRMRDEK